MNKKIVIEKTNGKKTESIGLLMILFQVLMIVKPDLVDPGTEKAITFVLGTGVIPTLFHRYYRNNKEKFTNLHNKLKRFLPWKK